MAVPMDRPVLYRLGYNAPAQQLYLCLDLALTRATEKFPGRASFRFVVYPVDPDWGLRSAADRYYHIYPELFAERTPQGALTSGTIGQGTPTAAELGFAYNWASGRDAENVNNSRAQGLMPLLYSDSMRYLVYMTIPAEAKPSRGEIAQNLTEFLQAPEPQRLYLDRPDVMKRFKQLCWWQGLSYEELSSPEAADYLRAIHRAVERSAFHDADGGIVPTYYHSAQYGYEHYRYHIHTARVLCDPDPDIPGGYGQFLLDDVIGRRFAWMQDRGARFDGVSLDNYFVNAKDLDYRREHFAWVDYPLTFDSALRPVLVGDFAMCEFTEALARRLRAEGGCLAANTCRMRFPFVASWLDVNLFESGMQEFQVIARTLAWHRPVVSLPIRPEHREEAWIKGAHLRMACFPGGGTSLLKNQELMALYGRYMPALKQMAEAGWEPLTFARTDDADVLVERYGSGAAGDLCFSLVNRSQAGKTVEVRLDLAALGFAAERPADLQVRDLVDRGAAPAPVTADGRFSLAIAPGDTIAVEVAPAG